MEGKDSGWHFTFSESGGIIVLATILCLLIFVKAWVIPISKKGELPSIDELNSHLSEMDSRSKTFNKSLENEYHVFSFDPNQIEFDSLNLLFMDATLTQRFINYRAAIGGFKSVNEIKKVYGLDSSTFSRIEPLLKWSTDVTTDTKSNAQVERSEKFQFNTHDEDRIASPTVNIRFMDINTAKAEEFENIYGIGSVLANRIVKYRKALGGFASLSQLYEVYGVDTTRIDFSSWHFDIDSSKLKKISINNSPIDSLARHPYLSWKQAKVIFNYRTLHGPYAKAGDLLQTGVVSDDQLTQLLVYLNFE